MSMYVVSHKNTDLILPENYNIIAVGNNKKTILNRSYTDDVGDNISYKNSSYCELTALYWLWKNSNDTEIGLCHYRRLFMYDDLTNNNIISFDELSKILKNVDIVLPFIHHMNMTVYQHYANAHIKEDMDKVGEIINNMYPKYKEAFFHIMNGYNEYGFNIFTSNKEITNEYCTWLFSILTELESIVDITNYNDYQQRIFGFLSERLFNVWIYYQKLLIKELPIKNPEYSEEKNYQKKLRKIERPKYVL